MALTRRHLLATGAAAAAGLSVAGCGRSGAGGGPSPTDLNFCQAVQVTSLAPMGKQPQGYPSGYEAAFAVYSGLVRLAPDMSFQPDLARRWSVAADGRTWTFQLRTGVRFHDGTAFGADDVVGYFTKMLDPDYNLSAYSLWSPIASVRRVDARTVRITTKQPYSALLNTLAHGSGLIPSRALVAAGEAKAALHAVGTGPYTLSSFTPGSRLVLERNRAYFGALPPHETLTFTYVGDASGRLAALEAGQAQLIDALPVEQAKSVTLNASKRLSSGSGLQTFGIGINQANPLLTDVRVRRALNLAVDVPAIVKVVLRGRARTLTSPLAERTNGYAKVGAVAHDKARALELLRQAGCTTDSAGRLHHHGRRVVLRLRTPDGMYVNDVLVAQAVQAELAEIGIAVTIQKVDKSTFWAGIQVAKKAGDFDLALFGFNPSHGSGALQLDIMYRSNASADKVAGWNFYWYRNDRVDRLLTEALTTVDAARQRAVMRQAQQLIWHDYPYIWLYAPDNLIAYDSTLAHPVVLPVGFALPSRTS